MGYHRTMAMPSRAGRSSRIAMASRPSNPLPWIAGIGGGALFLLIIVAAASSGGGEKAPPRQKKVEPPPPPPAETARAVEDTGPIMFICANSSKHIDKEYLISTCPSCPTRARFYWDDTIKGFRCLSCRQPYPNDLVKCPDCGKVPQKVRIKHRPG